MKLKLRELKNNKTIARRSSVFVKDGTPEDANKVDEADNAEKVFEPVESPKVIKKREDRQNKLVEVRKQFSGASKFHENKDSSLLFQDAVDCGAIKL